MDRRGYLVVRNDHALFSKHARDEIEGTARQVLSEIQSQREIVLPAVRFSIRAQAVGSQTPTVVISTAFPEDDHPAIRMLLVATKVPDPIFAKRFSNNDLLVVIEEAAKAIGAHIKKGISPTSCKIITNGQLSARLVEDLIVDLTLGNYFKNVASIGQLVDREGLPSLFAKKVRFARRSLRSSGLVRPGRGASYIMLSSLGDAADQDIGARAKQAFSNWIDFVNSITVDSLVTEKLGHKVWSYEIADARFFRKLKKVGGQLPIAKISARLAAKPKGQYVLVVLLTRARGKAPAFRHQIAHIFGKHARRNSFKIIPKADYVSALSILRELSMTGHIFMTPFAT